MEKFRGVYPHKDGGFTASIGVSGKSEYLGYFKDFDSARRARVEAEIKHTGSEYDRREVIINADHACIPLHGRRGVFYGYALVDLDDLALVQDIAWTLDAKGYAAGRPAGSGNAVQMHRLIVGELQPGQCTDHADRNKLNNRSSNLRICNQAQNARNTSLAKNNTSGAKGVRKTKAGTWMARITMDRQEIHIGTYATKAEAAAAYDVAARATHGEFCSPNSA